MSMEKQPEDYITAGETPDTPSGISERNKLPLFFSSPELTQCTDLLRHLTENTDLIPLVKGDEGAGKTTLLFRFQSLAADNWSVCRIDANPTVKLALPPTEPPRQAADEPAIPRRNELAEHRRREQWRLRRAHVFEAGDLVEPHFGQQHRERFEVEAGVWIECDFEARFVCGVGDLVDGVNGDLVCFW